MSANPARRSRAYRHAPDLAERARRIVQSLREHQDQGRTLAHYGVAEGSPLAQQVTALLAHNSSREE